MDKQEEQEYRQKRMETMLEVSRLLKVAVEHMQKAVERAEAYESGEKR